MKKIWNFKFFVKALIAYVIATSLIGMYYVAKFLALMNSFLHQH